MYPYIIHHMFLCLCVQLFCDSEGRREQRGSIVGLCVAQIVLLSGKVETQHSSEVWLPGERGGKKREKQSGRAREGELHRCRGRKNERRGRKGHEVFGHGSWKMSEAESNQEMNTEIGRNS